MENVKTENQIFGESFSAFLDAIERHEKYIKSLKDSPKEEQIKHATEFSDIMTALEPRLPASSVTLYFIGNKAREVVNRSVFGNLPDELKETLRRFPYLRSIVAEEVN